MANPFVQLIPGAGSAWLSYVKVPDIKAATKKAQDLGAKVMKDVTEVMGMGFFSIIVDPTGAMHAKWTMTDKQHVVELLDRLEPSHVAADLGFSMDQIRNHKSG